MSARSILQALTISLCLTACATGHIEPGSRDPNAPERQLLVMFSTPAPHFRPEGNYGGGYQDSSGREGTRRLAEAVARENKLSLVSDWPMAGLGLDCFVMQVSPASSVVEVEKSLASDSRVESVQAMHVFHVLANGDPLYPVQPSAKLWHLADLHHVATGRGVRIAEVDTGVEVDHPDLKGQVSAAKNFVDENPYAAEMHGTAVAGIMVAIEDNGVGIIGVAPNAKLIVLRACWQASDHGAYCNSFTLAKALQFALTSDVQVINLSLGGPPDQLLRRLLDVALSRGITIVAAMDPGISDGGFPSSHAGVLAVGNDAEATSRRDSFLAPGQDIPTTVPGGGWNFVTGSSYAAAQVSGVVALLREVNPQIQLAQIRLALSSAAIPSRVEGPSTVDACASVTQTAGICACDCRIAHDTVTSRP